MCHVSVLEFFIENVKEEEFRSKNILEIGSRYSNGSIRPLIERFFSVRGYVGVDIKSGKFVDVVLPAEKLAEKFGREQFDVVIATELLEHVRDWKLVIENMKTVLKRNGYLYITTRSFGFPYHEYPADFWRYESYDMKKIFSDFIILNIKTDPMMPGVCLKARKPLDYKPMDLTTIELYSMISGKRTKLIPKLDMPLMRKIKLLILPKVLASPNALYKRIFKVCE